ncbi:MAG: hypothetical protein PVG78_11525 [Desulfobacterales bacterium]|jgi:hypothetical protein
MASEKTSRSATLIREIETYRAHCLFAEARKRAVELANLILENERLKDKKKLLMAVVDKIEAIEEEAESFAAVGKNARQPQEEQRWARKVFSSAFEPGTDAAAYEGATALMVFGQFNAALTAFEILLESDEFRAPAAKNIIRCLLGIGSAKKAVGYYRQWLQEKAFAPRELEVIRSFLQRALHDKGVSITLPKPEDSPPPKPAQPAKPSGRAKPVEAAEPAEPAELAPIELTLELLSITVTVEDEFGERKRYTLDVNFQRGKTFSLIVSGKERQLVRYLSPGRTLTDVMFEATDLTYYASCMVYGNSRIRVGEKMGDYTITLKLMDQ